MKRNIREGNVEALMIVDLVKTRLGGRGWSEARAGMAARLGFAQADERVAIVDGADWIREQLDELDPQRLPLDGLGLDFYHLSENVHKCRREVFGEDDESGEKWASDLLHSFKHEGYVSSWESLLAWRVGLGRSRKKRASADKLLSYVSTRESMIGYPEFRSRGWQIGSGPTESRCKTTTSRLKGRGRRWDPRNAEKVSKTAKRNGKTGQVRY